MKNIVITGSGGFIGKNLTEYLGYKYNVYSVSHNDLDLLNMDKAMEFFQNRNVDVIIHCANEGGSRKTAYDIGKNNVVENNLKMFFNIVKILKPNMKLIYFGSGAEYDKDRELKEVSEKEFGEFIPNDSYGFSKFVMSSFSENHENIINLRLFGVYGKYEDYRYKFISNSIVKNLLKMPIIINQNVIFDYLFVDDLMNIVEKFIEHDYKDKIYNVTPDNHIDLVTIANIINSISNYKSEIILKNSDLNREYTANNLILKQNIGNYQFVSYEQGIKNLYEYYRSVIDDIDMKEIKKDEYLKYCKSN